ncbi:MAG: SBBP repeat-containing protein [Candidatus Binatia bacterium]
MVALGVAVTGLPRAARAAAPMVDYQALLAESVGYQVTGVAADRDGNVWVVGSTTSHNLPVTAGAIDTHVDAQDFDEGFVLKFDAAGALLYASYLGGRNVDDVASLAVDEDGNAYVAGTTLSDDLPTTPGAYQPALASAGTEDAFLVKLSPAGALLHATYFGGNSRDLFPGGVRGNPGVAVALGPDGSVYLAGGTNSTDLPTSSGHQRQYGGGTQDAFLARFSATLQFERCTYLGGDNNEGAYRVQVDPDGNVYLFGLANRILGQPWTFPVTPGALLVAPTGDPLNFVAKFDPNGALAYATFLGPPQGDPSLGQFQGDLAVDAEGHAYVVGVTGVANYPTTPGAFQTTLRGFSDLFVSKLAPDGASLVYSTYFGGGAAEYANGEAGVRIAVRAGDGAIIAGVSDSVDLPLVRAFETTTRGSFVAKLTADGSGLDYSSFVAPFGVGVGAIALGQNPLGPPGPPPYIDVYVAGPTAEPRGLSVLGIGQGSPSPACLGDCNGNLMVAINELIAGVGIALGRAGADVCPAFDPDGDGRVPITALISAVGTALRGCAVP